MSPEPQVKVSRPRPAGPSPRVRRLALLALGGLLLAGAAALYLHFAYGLSVGQGPAGPPVPRAAFQAPWSSRPVLLLGLGDSVTAGFGARRGYSYFDRLAKNPPDEFAALQGLCLGPVFPQLQATNRAVSGSTSFEVLGQLAPLPTQDSNTLGWVVLTTGGNDLIHNYGKTPPRPQAMYGAAWEQAKPWVVDFGHRLDAIVAALNERFPGGCHIFLASIYDPTDGVGDIERSGMPAWPEGSKVLAAYNETLWRCAQSHPNVHLVDMRAAFLGHGLHSCQFWSKHYDSHDPHYWYFSNLEDPNERGYDAIRRLFLNEMSKLAKPL